MTIREQVSDAVQEQSAQACINQHLRNIHTLYAMPDGRIFWDEEVSTNSWRVLSGTTDPVAIIFRTEVAFRCNCDACMAGEDPATWAGEDANELLDDLLAGVDAVAFGYFDDEQEA